MSFGAALGSIAGDLTGSALSAYYNRKEASKNRRFQQFMSGTATTRSVKDMRNAGLNPILALGNPATTPSGAQASISPVSLGSSGIAASSAKQAIEQSRAQEALLKEQRDLAKQSARKTAAEADGAEFDKALKKKAQPFLEDTLDALTEGGGLTTGNVADVVKKGAGKAREVLEMHPALNPDVHDAVRSGIKWIRDFAREKYNNAKEYFND